MELRRGAGLLCYYDLTDRQIYLSMPDLKAPTGLQLMILRQMIGAENIDTLMRFLAIFIPFVVAHEMTHHFRYRYGSLAKIAGTKNSSPTKWPPPSTNTACRKSLRRAIS